MKNIYFLSSLPRAGNTLLGSIINDNNNIKCTANSIVPSILDDLFKLKETSVFKNFPDHESLDNVIKNVFNKYYENWNVDVIIEKSSWGTPDNLKYVKHIVKNPKFILLIRPVLECISSFVKLELERGINENQIKDYVYNLMDVYTGAIGKALWSIENIIKTKQNYKIVYYKDLVNDTNFFLKDLSEYVKVDIKKPNKLKQFSVNNIKYDDSVYIENLHNIKTESIESSKYDVLKYIPKEIIEKYK